MKNILLGLTLLLYFSCASTEKKQEQKPNVIWLMAEDISLDLECYGMKAVKTPNLNRLAEEGTRFDNCYVTNPICSPSRSAMLIGTHQVKINAHNHRSNRNIPLDSNYKPFTSYLRDAGYTCILGHHGVKGFGQKIDANFKTEKVGEWNGVDKFGIFDKLNHFEKEDQPFFAQIQLVATHRGSWWNEVREQSKHPVNPADVELPSYLAEDPAIRLDWAKYLDQMEYIDDEVGMIVQELKDKEMDKNTIIIFIGDNGRCNWRGKGYLHDPGLHIPLIIYDPRSPSEVKVSKQMVSATDITATILDYADVEIPSYFTGESIFSNKKMKRKFVYSARDLWDEIEEKMRSITTDRYKYIRNDKPELPWDAHQAYLEFYRPAVHVMRRMNEEGRLSPVQAKFFGPNKPEEELYDLKNDPEELVNLATDPQYKDILEKLRKQTATMDKKMTPISDVYNPIAPKSVEVFDWVVAERPDVYKEMQAGVEVGFKKLTSEYKQCHKKK